MTLLIPTPLSSSLSASLASPVTLSTIKIES
nr:MAG TPA: hypothetical protein [Caudoviricetes sp.]DAU58451.1 MAG TPA: hypothetical protein [Caudoviricetes sp.]